MARISTAGLEMTEDQLNRLGRDGIRRIVEAGSAAAQASMRSLTEAARHVRNGDLMGSIRPGKLYESLNAASQFVEFEGEHPGGITNHDLAWILDNGPHGDKFITKGERNTEQAATEAMQKESDKILEEVE